VQHFCCTEIESRRSLKGIYYHLYGIVCRIKD